MTRMKVAAFRCFSLRSLAVKPRLEILESARALVLLSSADITILEKLERGIATHAIGTAQVTLRRAVDLDHVHTVHVVIRSSKLIPSGSQALAMATPRSCMHEMKEVRASTVPTSLKSKSRVTAETKTHRRT